MPAPPETQFRPRLPARPGRRVPRRALPVLVLFCFLATGAFGDGRYGTPLRFPPPPVDVFSSSPVETAPAPSAAERNRNPPFPDPAPVIRTSPGSAPPASVGLAPSPPLPPVPAESAPAPPAPVAPAPPDFPEPALLPPLPAEPDPLKPAPPPVPPASAEPAPAVPAPAAPPPARTPAEEQQAKPLRLFGTVEFRSVLKNLPKWERVLATEARARTFAPDGQMPANVRPRWDKLEAELRGKPPLEQLQRVNNFFNQWPYKTDPAVWGVEDYWATPREFMQKSGDCEDYAIAKYYALRSLGIPAAQLRIVALKDTLRNLWHAVLAYIEGDKAYILDNLTNLVLSHQKLTHYDPQFSVNEEYLWRHVKPVARQAGK